jgi:competence CoiA-like predicted nuclease
MIRIVEYPEIKTTLLITSTLKNFKCPACKKPVIFREKSQQQCFTCKAMLPDASGLLEDKSNRIAYHLRGAGVITYVGI